MQSVESESIIRSLFEKYYADRQNDGGVYSSSHWRQLHEQTTVNFNGNDVVSLKGVGFGDLQNRSFIYQFFSWLTILCYVLVLKDWYKILQLLPSAMQLSRKMGMVFTYDAFRQVCVLAALEPYFRNPRVRIINIGDGYGFLSLLIKTRYPETKIFLVDLGKTLLFQAYYCQKIFVKNKHCLVRNEQDFSLESDFVYCAAEDLEVLKSQTFNIAINIASMQEMNKQTVERYFLFLRQSLHRDGYFYCCNREEKVMVGGEISRLTEYPWQSMDQHFWDDECPWYRFFLSIHRTVRGSQIGRFRIPFVNYFDGAVRHRLTKLQTFSEVKR